MSRLGDRLLAAGLLTHEQLEQALRAQVLWGGRLGTNLIELGCIDLDQLATALGKQHALPPALGRHFERADAELQQQFPAELAAKHCVVPLLRFGNPPRVAVVSIDPLSPEARAEIAGAFGIEADQIVPSIAPEMRVRYHLERVYGIQRAARFLRSRGKTIPPFPLFDPAAMPFDIEEPTSPTLVPETPPPARLPAEADEIAAMIDAAVDSATRSEAPAGGRERRSYVRLIVDEPKTDEPKLGDTQPLGRMAIRKVAVAPPRSRAPTRTMQSLADATRAIRRGPDRDRVADLVIDTVQRFAPACSAAMLLVIRGEVAIAWKHFARDGGGAPELAVPMDQPGMCPTSAQHTCVARSSAGHLGPVDELLLRSLGRTDGELVVVPVPIAGKVMCLIAAGVDQDAEISSLEAIAAAAGAAFARLIRDASR
jgi:hypothetical protein